MVVQYVNKQQRWKKSKNEADARRTKHLNRSNLMVVRIQMLSATQKMPRYSAFSAKRRACSAMSVGSSK